MDLSLDEGTQIPRGVGAEVRYRNLVGQRMVTLVETDSSESGFLSDGDSIPLERTKPAFDLSVLFNGLRPLIRSTDPEDINIVTREVVAALKGRGKVTVSPLRKHRRYL